MTETSPAARGMRLAKREVIEPAELLSIIDRARVLHVGCVDDEGMLIVPMNFGYDWDVEDGTPTWTIWLHSATAGRKADAWAHGAKVAVELEVEGGIVTGDYACAYSYAYESVMAWGTIRPVTDPHEKLHGLVHIMGHMAPGTTPTFSDEAVERVGVWRIDVERLTGKRRPAMTNPSAKAASHDKTSCSKKGKKTKGNKKASGKKGGKDDDKKPKTPKDVLKGRRCDGCGHKCKLSSPRCGHGKKLREKVLAKAR